MNPTGEAKNGVLRLAFERRVMIHFRGSVVTSDAGLLAYRELDDALGLSESASDRLADSRTGKNGRHALVGMLRQSVFGRLAGFEDVNDAERLRHDPAMRWIIGGKAAKGHGASPSQMGRFETRWLAQSENLAALTDLSGQWIDRVAKHRRGDRIVLDLDSSVSPTHGEQENSVWNGHFGCTCYHPLRSFSSTSMATWSAAYFALETSTAPMAGKASSSPSSRATSVLATPSPFAAMRPSRNPACTSTSSRRESSMQSGCRLIRFSKRGLQIYSHDRSVAHRTTSCDSIGVFATEQRVGPVRDASLPK
jgi:hypothetical protein